MSCSYATKAFSDRMLNSRSRRICIFLLQIFTAQITAGGAVKHYCPYFKNRAPSPQRNLENCTWFRENSCCLNHELNEILSTITTPLKAASEECSKHTAYLMCYVCAPNQDTFYEEERLTVCEEFCDRWYTSCGNAMWKGYPVRNLYKTGREFCEARKFLVASKDDKTTGCYTFTLQENSAVVVNTSFKLTWFFALTVATLWSS